jgi:hypothetical protein
MSALFAIALSFHMVGHSDVDGLTYQPGLYTREQCIEALPEALNQYRAQLAITSSYFDIDWKPMRALANGKVQVQESSGWTKLVAACHAVPDPNQNAASTPPAVAPSPDVWGR